MTRELISVSNLTVGYDDGVVVLKDVSFNVRKGDIFVIMGPSGCGKSTLLRAMTGLVRPVGGRIHIFGHEFIDATPTVHDSIMRRTGVLFQSGALLGSMTVGENVALPLQNYTNWSARKINHVVAEKLALVGLKNACDYYPSELSGGMKKRAGLARALALDPEIVYLDEPSAGLDPISSKQLDDLILEINHGLGTTVVMVSHELASIFAVGDDAIFLDGASGGIAARGRPRDLLKNSTNETLRHFLTRGKN